MNINKQNQIYCLVGVLTGILGELPKKEKEKYGRRAMEVLEDYPLYASTCGISYEEAIAMALICGEETLFMEEES